MSAFTKLLTGAAVIWCAVALGAASSDPTLSPKERLGKRLFFDQTLSARGNQSCATCHSPQAGWAGGDDSVNLHGAVYEGSLPGRFGNRKPPSAAYATQAPAFARTHRGAFVGGSFWDGRATGERFGSPAADQAVGPFLNPAEHAVPDVRALVERVCGGASGDLFREVWGSSACTDLERGYQAVGLSIAAFEASRDVNRFDSKFDAFLDGTATLTAAEQEGWQLFTGKARCALCHPARRGSDGSRPLFTNFTFANLGVPRNAANPFYRDAAANPHGTAWTDDGLGAFLATVPQYAHDADAQRGKHKVPTLRNVDLRPSPRAVKAYGHNGYFKSLKEIVHFYNTRYLLPRCRGAAARAGFDCWPAPEVAANVDTARVGLLGLTAAEEDAIVAFLATLSDGYAGR